jgi:hypothetical protein
MSRKSRKGKSKYNRETRNIIKRSRKKRRRKTRRI